MRLLSVANIIGAVGAAIFAGWLTSKGPASWFAIASAAIFFVALIWPVVAEYRSVDRHFAQMQESFLSRTRAPYFPQQEQQVIAPGDDGAPTLDRYRPPVGTVLFLTVVAAILLGVEAGLFLMKAPPPQSGPGPITNF